MNTYRVVFSMQSELFIVLLLVWLGVFDVGRRVLRGDRRRLARLGQRRRRGVPVPRRYICYRW